jgi:hypothetical protein
MLVTVCQGYVTVNTSFNEYAYDITNSMNLSGADAFADKVLKVLNENARRLSNCSVFARVQGLVS